MIVTTDGRVSSRTDHTDRAPSGGLITSSTERLKKAIHIFDSSGGLANSSGYFFRYNQSLDKIVGYRVVDILVTGIPAPFSNPVFLSVHSNLSRASYSGHRNGKAENIISCICNPGTSGRILWLNPQYSMVPIEMDTMNDMYLELRDPVGAPQPQLRFVIQIEIYQEF